MVAKPTQEEAALAPEVRAKYEAVIGLEVHVQLLTKSKIFCACSTAFGDPPNTNVCPVCLGLPGTLPVLNKRAVELAMRAAGALNFRDINPYSRFARKNYFYPDLPKGYQISQYELPLATNGGLEIEVDGEKHWVGITRLHLEEDAAKNLHEGFSESATKAYIDYNRCGTPLCEIVSEPDMRDENQAYAYLTTLAHRMLYANVSDCDMEEGSLRCDANISVRPHGSEKFGVKVEVKNLNSFRFVKKAIRYEIDRQIRLIESQSQIYQETRHWNQDESRTTPMRSKEKAHDYRYFPEPDLLPVQVSNAWRAEILSSLPEFPETKRLRFVADYGITPYDAGVLTVAPSLADYFESVVKAGAPGKTAANWIQTELLRRLNDSGTEIERSPVTPTALSELLGLVDSGQITGAVGKKVFATMFETARTPSAIVASEGLGQIVDRTQVRKFLVDALIAHPERIEQYRAGKTAVAKSFVGDAMKLSKGRIKPQEVQDELNQRLTSEAPAVTSTNTTTTGVIFVKLDGTILPPTSPEVSQGTSAGSQEAGRASVFEKKGYPELWAAKSEITKTSESKNEFRKPNLKED